MVYLSCMLFVAAGYMLATFVRRFNKCSKSEPSIWHLVLIVILFIVGSFGVRISVGFEVMEHLKFRGLL